MGLQTASHLSSGPVSLPSFPDEPRVLSVPGRHCLPECPPLPPSGLRSSLPPSSCPDPVGTAPEETWEQTEEPAKGSNTGACEELAAPRPGLCTVPRCRRAVGQGLAAPSLASAWRAATLAQALDTSPTRRLLPSAQFRPCRPRQSRPGCWLATRSSHCHLWPPGGCHRNPGETSPLPSPGRGPLLLTAPSLPSHLPWSFPRLATDSHDSHCPFVLSPSSCLSAGPPTEAQSRLSSLPAPHAPPTH